MTQGFFPMRTAIIAGMRRIPWIPVLVIILLALSGVLAYWRMSPRLLGVSPPEGANAVPAGTSLRIDFSRQLRTEDILERLVIQPPVPVAATWQGLELVLTPNDPWPSGESVEVVLEPGARADDWIGLPLRQEVRWKFNIGQPHLLYLYPHDGPADIYELNPYSGESQRWTRSPAGVESFSVTSNGTAIYYSIRADQGSSAIYRMDTRQEWLPADEADRLDPNQIPESELVLDCPRASCRDPVVSPDGNYLAYERVAFVGGEDPSYPQVWLLPLDSQGSIAAGAEPILAGPELHQTLEPAWSSQSVLSIYDTNLTAFMMLDPPGGILTQFANQTGQPGDWHPNGDEFVAPEINFLGENTSPQLDNLQPLANSHLILFHLVDGKTQSLTQEEDLEDTAPAFSPDGAYLAFARKSLQADSWTPGRQLWLMRTGTWSAEALTNDELYNHYDFAWDPAGKLLAYVRFNQSVLSDPPELWIMDPFSGQRTQLVIGGYLPQWIR